MMQNEYLVWCEDYGQTKDDARKIISKDAQWAAEEWADWSDYSGARYEIVKGRDVIVTVQLDADIVRYVVSGVSVARYTGRQIKGG